MNASTIIEQNLDQLVILRGEFGNFVAGDDRVVFERRVAEIERHGAEPVFARNLITLRFLDQLLEILRPFGGNFPNTQQQIQQIYDLKTALREIMLDLKRRWVLLVIQYGNYLVLMV